MGAEHDLPTAFQAYNREETAQARAAGPGKNGVLEARLVAGPNGTRLFEDLVKVPFHLTGPLSPSDDPACSVYIQSPTGGLAQGDRQRMAFTVGPDACGSITTQSATKVHRMDRNYGRIETSFSIGTDGYLEYIPDPTILNAGSRLFQTTDLTLERGATAILADVISPTGMTDDAPYDFERLYARLSVRDVARDRQLVTDTVHCAPGDRDPRGPGAFGDYDAFGTLYAIDPDGDTERLASRIHDRLDSDDETVLAGSSILPYDAGVSVRVLGESVAGVTDTVHAAWDTARIATLGTPAPDHRKY